MPAAGSGAPSAGGGAPAGALEALIELRAVAPGDENHVCVVVELANSAPVWVSELHATLTDGSHHLIVDRRAAGSALQTQAIPCSPTMGGDDTRLMIAQQHDSRIALPRGVAYRLEPHQRIFLQLHYINLKAAPADIRGTLELRLAEPSAGTPKEAQSIFSGSLDIAIDPHAAGTAQYFVRPAGASAGRPQHVFALTSHTHSLGVRATIERVASIDAAPTTPIHLSENWAEPPLTLFSPALDFTGSDGLRLICHYMNNTDRSVHFGTEFNDEMCFMWMYFYLD